MESRLKAHLPPMQSLSFYRVISVISSPKMRQIIRSFASTHFSFNINYVGIPNQPIAHYKCPNSQLAMSSLKIGS